MARQTVWLCHCLLVYATSCRASAINGSRNEKSGQQSDKDESDRHKKNMSW